MPGGEAVRNEASRHKNSDATHNALVSAVGVGAPCLVLKGGVKELASHARVRMMQFLGPQCCTHLARSGREVGRGSAVASCDEE